MNLAEVIYSNSILPQIEKLAKRLEGFQKSIQVVEQMSRTLEQTSRILEQVSRPLEIIRVPQIIIPISTDLVHVSNRFAYRTLRDIVKGDKETLEYVYNEVWKRSQKRVDLSSLDEFRDNLISFLWEASYRILSTQDRQYFDSLEHLYSYLAKSVSNSWKKYKKRETWQGVGEIIYYDDYLKLQENKQLSWSPERRYFELVYPVEERVERLAKKLLQYISNLREEEQAKVVLYLLSDKDKTEIWGSKTEMDKSRAEIRRELGDKRYTAFMEILEDAKNLVEISIFARQYLTNWLLERLRRWS